MVKYNVFDVMYFVRSFKKVVEVMIWLMVILKFCSGVWCKFGRGILKKKIVEGMCICGWKYD